MVRAPYVAGAGIVQIDAYGSRTDVVQKLYVRCVITRFTFAPQIGGKRRDPMTNPKTMTKTQRRHWQYAIDARRMIEYDLHSVAAKLRCLPKEWDEIWEDIDRRAPKKVPLTIRLDADVVKFFKAMGEGYQPRINRVLRSFMHYRLAGIINGPDTTDYVLHPDRMMKAGQERPGFGSLQQMEAEMEEDMARFEKVYQSDPS